MCGLDEKKRAKYIDVVALCEVLRLDVRDLVVISNTRIVDEDVDAQGAEGIGGLRNERGRT